MAVVELTREQLSDAVRQLPRREQIGLLVELLAETDGFPKGDDARRLFAQLRPQFCMSSDDEQRMSDLQQKANAGELTTNERSEFDSLLNEAQECSLQLALAVMFSGRLRQPASGRSRGTEQSKE